MNNYPIILLLSAGAGFVASVITAGGIVWRGMFLIGRWFGETGKTLLSLNEKVDQQGIILGEQSIQLARLDERFDAMEKRLDRAKL